MALHDQSQPYREGRLRHNATKLRERHGNKGEQLLAISKKCIQSTVWVMSMKYGIANKRNYRRVSRSAAVFYVVELGSP